MLTAKHLADIYKTMEFESSPGALSRDGDCLWQRFAACHSPNGRFDRFSPSVLQHCSPLLPSAF